MLGLSALELARIQFGFTISFHIIFPAITIGLASYLAVLEGLWLWKQEPVYRNLHHFWARIFAVNFAMGVVSGLVMATNSAPTGATTRLLPAASPARCSPMR
jgi:cytochrome d ubiquinol oxidase subunit I